MSLTQINVKPYWKETTVEKMDVTMTITGTSYKEGDRLCSMQLETVTIPGCEAENLQISDDNGTISMQESEETPYPYKWRRWNAKRDTKGAVQITYTVRPRVLKPEDICGPYFDFRAEEGGANSAGISILMDVENAGSCELSWDLSAMPKGSRGVCTFGENGVKTNSLEQLRESYFAVGQLNAIEEGDFGFYWMSQPPFDVKEVAEYTKKLFGHMQKFFKDTEKVYRIFVRKDPFLTSGGTALYRSYMFGWNTTQPCSLADKKAILAHEMVHNWPDLNDNPYGTTTWYSEGTAEYYSVLLPLRLGLITDEDAIKELQKRTDKYYANPTRTLGDEEAAAICWKDRRAQRLVYGRGMIFFINMDIRIREATSGAHSVDDVVLDILEQKRSGGVLGNEVFLETVKRISGLDVRSEWEAMHTGKEIVPLDGGFDGRFAVVEKKIEEADTGKSVRSWRWLKKFTPETMKEIVYVTWPALAPAGDKVAWVDWKGDMKSGLFSSKIHLMENLMQDGLQDVAPQDVFSQKVTGAEGKNASRKESVLTPDGVNEKQPALLSDGIHMIYLSDETGAFQVFIKNLATNEKRQITTLRHGVLRYQLSDDETKLVFEATLWPDEVKKGIAFTEMTPEQKAEWEEELDWTPYEITTLTYKMDEWHGMRKGEFSHIGTANVASGEQKLFAAGRMETMEAIFPTWSHDGKRIAFHGYPYDGAKGRRTELFICDENGESLRQVSTDAGIYPDHAPAFTADDKAVVTMVFGDFEDGSCVQLPVLFDLSDGTHRYLIGEWDESLCHGVHPLHAGSLEYGDHSPYFMLTKDGKYLYFQTGRHGRYSLCRVRIDNVNAQDKSQSSKISQVADAKTLPSPVEMVLEGQTDIQEFAMNKNGQIVTIQADWLHPAELWMNGKQLTDSNPWLSEYALADVEERWVTSKDGKANLQYFLVKPVGFEEGTQYPAVLDIKGGPETMYGLTFWHEFQALASAGMAVIFGNPRGSTGFGRAYCADGVCWGNEAMDDLVQFVEDAVSRGIVDEKRVGVTGGSYGGYMTNKLIGRTNVFAAAVAQRCLANTATSYGTGDMGFVSSRPIPKHFHMLDYLEGRARGNIISYIDHFKVPLLILHAYQDYRCGFEQAEQVFIPMKERNPEIPCRMVMFPNENHGMTRGGKLYHQVRHLQEMTDWFVKYLINEPDWNTKQKNNEKNNGNHNENNSGDDETKSNTDFMATQEEH